MQTGPVYIILHYFKLTRLLSWIALVFAASLIVLGVFTFRIADFQQTERSGEDLRCYYSIVERIHSGEGYYHAAREELQTRGYTTSSVFNWRMPFLATLLGKLPSVEVARIIAVLLSLLSLWLWIDVAMKKMSVLRIAAGAIPLVGSTIYCFLGIIFVMHELWAGILISISLFAYGKGWRTFSLISGISSVFIRELSLLFVAIMFFLSFVERKRGEAMAWLAGILAFFTVLTFHAMQVDEFTKGSGNLDLGQWLAFGGWNFVMATIQIQPFLLISPSWCTAIVAPLALVGFLGWRGSMEKRIGLIITAYVLLFLFVGRNNNAYWGLMYCNMVPLGLLYTNEVLSRAFSACRAEKHLQEL